MTDLYAELASDFLAGRAEQAFAKLVEQLRTERRFHELFDARLLAVRHKFGLPIVGNLKLDEVPEASRQAVEEAYLAACREVGELLVGAGRLRDAWLYLRPAGAQTIMRAALQAKPADEEAAEEYIEVALHEGVDPPRGFGLVLEHYGTCNSITTFESQLQRFPLADQQACAALLIRRVHEELTTSVRADIQRQEGLPPVETTLAALVEPRDWLFLNAAYHIDTTHLAAVVRFARICDDPEVLRLALDLTEYGRRLDPQYHFESDEPFRQLYSHHALWFRAILGEQQDEAIAFFRQQAEQVDREVEGPAAVETYIWLLVRLKKFAAALTESRRLLPPDARRIGLAPPLLDLAQLAGDFQPAIAAAQEQGDLVGYAAAVLGSAARNRR